MYKKSNKRKQTKEMFDKIINGVTQIIETGGYTRFLKCCKNFHNYSFNNWILIFLQKEDATMVAGFKKWQSMGRKVKAHEKGIQILYPLKITKEVKKQDNTIEQEETKTVEYLTYRPTYVFDISQTEGEPIPIEEKVLNSNNMIQFFEFLKSYSPYPILDKEIYGGAKGYWNKKDKHIVLRKELSIDDKVSVLLHELTHALYDDFNYKEDRNLSETFVESVAFIVTDYFGLDTSICSFNYITSWAYGDIKVVLELGDKIKKTADKFIKELEKYQNENIKIVA